LFVSGSTQDAFSLVKTSGSSGLLRFGIDRFILVTDIRNTAVYYSDISRMLFYTEMDSTGAFRQRYINNGTSFTSSITLGGLSSAETPFGYVLSNTGSSNYVALPIIDYGASKLDLSNRIINYSNSDNRRVTLEIGNYE
jgi:hypothetical protein